MTGSWLGLKDPRIIRVSRSFGGKDRHSKVSTIRGLRDRRVRLSVSTAIQLYDLQDRLGLNQPSKVVDWLLNAAQHEIDKLPPLPIPPTSANFLQFSQSMAPPTAPSSSTTTITTAAAAAATTLRMSNPDYAKNSNNNSSTTGADDGEGLPDNNSTIYAAYYHLEQTHAGGTSIVGGYPSIFQSYTAAVDYDPTKHVNHFHIAPPTAAPQSFPSNSLLASFHSVIPTATPFPSEHLFKASSVSKSPQR